MRNSRVRGSRIVGIRSFGNWEVARFWKRCKQLFVRKLNMAKEKLSLKPCRAPVIFFNMGRRKSAQVRKVHKSNLSHQSAALTGQWSDYFSSKFPKRQNRRPIAACQSLQATRPAITFHNRKIICQSEEKAWSSSACRTWPAGAGCRSPAAGSPRRSAWIVLAGVVHWPPPEPPACRIAESWKRAAFGCPVWPGRPSPQQLRSRFRRRRRSLLPRLPLGHRRRSGVAAGDVVTVCQIWWSFWSVCWHQFFPKPKQLQYCKLFYHLVSIHNYNILLITLLLWLIETCTAFWSCKYVLFL